MHLKSLALAAAVALSLGATTAGATIRVNDFESIGSATYAVNTVYAQQQLGVQYVGSTFGGDVFTQFHADGTYDFLSNGGGKGFFEIAPTDGSMMTSLDFRAGGTYAGLTLLYEELLADNTVVGIGSLGSLDPSALHSYTLTGVFNKVRLQGIIGSAFQTTVLGPPEGGVFDGLKATVRDAVPEPTTWALLLVGFAGLGSMLRYNRRHTALA